MKLTNKLIQAKTDFDYGRNNGLNYVAVLLQLATFVEVIHLNRMWYFVLIPAGISITWLLGFVLRKINFRVRENEFLNSQNKTLMEIKKSVKHE
jgi:hypothetical protein